MIKLTCPVDEAGHDILFPWLQPRLKGIPHSWSRVPCHLICPEALFECIYSLTRGAFPTL